MHHCHVQRVEREGLVDVATEYPTAYRASVSIQDHGQVDEAPAQAVLVEQSSVVHNCRTG